MYDVRVRESVFQWEGVAAVRVSFGDVVCVRAGSDVCTEAGHVHHDLVFELIEVLLLVELLDVLRLLFLFEQVHGVVIVFHHFEFFGSGEKLLVFYFGRLWVTGTSKIHAT